MPTTPVKNACILSAKNEYALVHAHICNLAEDSLTWKLLRPYPESCVSIVQAVVCRSLLLPLLLSRPNPSPDAVRPRNPSKSSLAHDAVATATAVSHKHHLTIRVGAGLIQFVYGSHSCLATDLIHRRIPFSPRFSWGFLFLSFSLSLLLLPPLFFLLSFSIFSVFSFLWFLLFQAATVPVLLLKDERVPNAITALFLQV